MRLEPISGSQPKIRVRLEIFCHLSKPRVVFLFFTNQKFSLVIESGLLDAILEPGVNWFHVHSNVFIPIQIVEGMEASDSDKKVV